MALFLERGSGTWSVKSRGTRNETAPDPEKAPSDPDGQTATRDNTTIGFVNPVERGDFKVKDEYEASDETSSETGRQEGAATARKEMALRISEAITRTKCSIGTTKLAADLQLLKRELSAGHDVLGCLPSESDFLSIVVLVESELGVRPWKEITKPELDALKSAIDIGIRLDSVTYDHYRQIFRRLNANGFTTGPKFDLEIVQESDVEIEEEPAEG